MVLLPIAITHVPSEKSRFESDDRLVFQHFPKTGGKTVHSCLAPLFDPSEICPEQFGRFALWPGAILEQFKFFSSHCTARDIQYIPGPVKTISFFRNPVERCISLYYFWRSVSLSESEGLRLLQPRFAQSHSPREFFSLTDIEKSRPLWNVYASGLAGDALFSPAGRLWRSDDELLEEALARLDQLAFVGISEDMAGSMDALCRQLDIQNLYVGQFHNVTPQQDAVESGLVGEIDEECLGLIEQANSLDMIVYDRALEIALGDRALTRTFHCVTGQMPDCQVRKRYTETWVENQAGGFILFGPLVRLLPGRYAVTFRLRRRPSRTEEWSAASMGHIEVVSRAGELVLARRHLPDMSVDSGDVYERLIFDVRHVISDAEFRVWASPGAPFDVQTTVSLETLRL